MSKSPKHFLAAVCVMFHKPLKGNKQASGMKPLVGYYRNIGLTAPSSEAARTMAADAITDGAIDWSDSSVERIDLNTFEPEIAVHCNEPLKEGIWYMSGRSIFPQD